uniref:Coiled-coil-helix-coiled-coil-helix domain containing 1 n=1 Tax=Amphiprion percula TaxID=161767 RepID=A0A3P8RQZ4_AMPPE
MHREKHEMYQLLYFTVSHGCPCPEGLLGIEESDSLGDETVAEPGCSRSDAAEPPPTREQGEQSMLWMRGVFDNVAGSAETALVCNILDGWKRGPDDLLCGRLSEATCITEISILMACWKQNNFVDSLCCNETNAFYTCVAKAQAAIKNKSGQSNIQGGRLPPKQATILLKRYPNQRSEI